MNAIVYKRFLPRHLTCYTVFEHSIGRIATPSTIKTPTENTQSNHKQHRT